MQSEASGTNHNNDWQLPEALGQRLDGFQTLHHVSNPTNSRRGLKLAVSEAKLTWEDGVYGQPWRASGQATFVQVKPPPSPAAPAAPAPSPAPAQNATGGGAAGAGSDSGKTTSSAAAKPAANIEINLTKKADPAKQLSISAPAPVQTEVIVKEPTTVEASVKVVQKGQASNDGGSVAVVKQDGGN
eukprot:gene7861-8057_t